MTETISVAVCADKNIEIGLHVTLYSLLQSSHQPIKINFVQDGYSDKDINNIRKTLQPFQDKYTLNVINYDPSIIFNTYRGLYGNKFTFVRIMLANLIEDRKVIYLDSDLIINKDLASLFELDLKGKVIGATCVHKIKYSLENNLFETLGLQTEDDYFNAGVMSIDLERWRQQNITEKCLKFGDKYSRQLMTADQTILNYIFQGNNFYDLGDTYNYAIYPNSSIITELDNQERIFHFVGSPKPWDLMGEFVHKNYSFFETVLNQTIFKGYKTYLNISPQKILKAIKQSRAYYLTYQNR